VGRCGEIGVEFGIGRSAGKTDWVGVRVDQIRYMVTRDGTRVVAQEMSTVGPTNGIGCIITSKKH
jgi:hypothetical protein